MPKLISKENGGEFFTNEMFVKDEAKKGMKKDEN